jgi:hypothetical protein
MSRVDDELTRRLRQTERPVDVDGLFEGLEHRRSHRERVRRVQAGLLSFAVLAATAGGFSLLTGLFDPDRRGTFDGGSTPHPTASTSPAPSPREEDARDIGLGVRMCDLEVLTDIDWDGTGIDGAAWTGAPVDEDGTCASAELAQHVVAVDRDGDGVAEQGSTSTLRSCLFCRPFDTVDLNGDGVLELVVLEEASSTPTYSVFEVNRPGSERAMGVYPIIVVPSGAPEMGLDPNEPVRFMVGGDEGFSGGIECEDDADGPILQYTWVRGAVDADTDLEVDITRLRFGKDGVFKVLSVDSFSVPRNPEPTDLISRRPACGVDFHPDA